MAIICRSALVVALLAFIGAEAQAQPGTLDPTFGVGGRVVQELGAGTPAQDGAMDVLLLDDGRVIVAGFSGWGDENFLVARYLADGVLDPTFGDAGTVIIPTSQHPTYPQDRALAVVAQPDGKIVVAGRALIGSGDNDFAVVRLAADGEPDATFGTNGVARMSVGWVGAEALALQADGGIVVAGGSAYPAGVGDFRIVRFTPVGELDSTFGDDGVVEVGFGYTYEGARDVVIRPDGRIIVAGYMSSGQAAVGAIAQLMPDGGLDPSFGTDGRVLASAGTVSTVIRALALQPDGRLIASGRRGGPLLLRYMPDGTPDPTFGLDGVVIVDVPSTEGIVDVGLSTDGRILGAGTTPSDTEYDALVVRRLPDGSPDPTFDDDGAATISMEPRPFRANGMAVGTDGHVVIAGMVEGSIWVEDVGVARLTPTGALDPAFGTGGKTVTALRQRPRSVLADAAVLPDGSVLAVGLGYPPEEAFSERTLAMAQFTSAGALDVAFGEGGMVTDRTLAGASSVALLADGRFLVALSQPTYAARSGVARFHPNGELDTSFGVGGVAGLGATYRPAIDIVVDAMGRIVVASRVFSGTSQNEWPDFAAARLTSEGVLDPSFSGDGWVALPLSPYEDEARDLDVLPDGRTLIAGYASINASRIAILVRLTAEGDLDASFGTAGRVITNFGGTSAEAHDVVLQPDGRALIAGGAAGAQGLARFDADGSLDSTFGAGGVVNIAAGPAAMSMSLQTDGGLVTVGSTGSEDQRDFGLRRFNPDGSPDETFGNGGLTVTDFGRGDAAEVVVIGTDGRIVAAGSSSLIADVSSFALARYLGGGGVPAEEGPASTDIALGLPRPNPARGNTAVVFDLPVSSKARLTVIDALGRRVVTLVDGERAAGRHEVTWAAGSHAPGVYLLRLEAAGDVQVQRVSVLR